jgi:hypothetical protein
MQSKELLKKLLEAETEEEVVGVLNGEGLLKDPNRWKYLGNIPNNQSIVQNQQSTATAAFVEKYTNGVDAILLKYCKAEGIDPRGPLAPQTMSDAITRYFGEIEEGSVRKLADENLILYATGSKARPCLSLYDAGEGQLPENFPQTFCSLISGSTDGSYKGAIPFVQGRFNMGGTGVLPFCSDKYKLQLIVSRVAPEVAKSNAHEWGFTLFCYFASKQAPSWKYLVGVDGKILTAGSAPLGLVPKKVVSGEASPPRDREVGSGTLVKMYDYKAPRSNVCGELFKKVAEYLLRPPLPLRIIECRPEYKANVMGVSVWNRFERWKSKGKLEEGFEEGASISIKLTTGETIPAEVRVFKLETGTLEEQDQAQMGLRALINGQCHASRDAQFFKTKAVNKEHIAGSMLVTLDCSELGQDSRNALFMSNRETFREDPLLADLFGKLQKELYGHEGLDTLDQKRYEDKIKNAIDDEEGINALEELLATDPDLADLFGNKIAGKVAAKTSTNGSGGKIPGEPVPYKGFEFPTFICRADKSTVANLNVPAGEVASARFKTDVKNNYFSRQKHRGKVTITGDFEPTFHLFNGHISFRYHVDKNAVPGTLLASEVVITDNVGSGPFKLTINITVLPAIIVVLPQTPKPPPQPKPPMVQAGPSRPDIKEMDVGPDALPLTIEKNPATERLQLVLNITSQQLQDAKKLRPPAEEPAVSFVFKYGLALTAMGLLDSAKKTPAWQEDESACRDRIAESAKGLARVIVPLCLSLPKKIPKLKN